MTFELDDLSRKWSRLLNADLRSLQAAFKKYGHSWKERGGVGAFMMLARKFDRIERTTREAGWDIFEAAKLAPGEDGILDDIADLRHYLLLAENEIREKGYASIDSDPSPEGLSPRTEVPVEEDDRREDAGP